MFADKVKVKIKGGDGGAGSHSFRREKFVPFGGPNGGDGGRGGDVYLVATRHLRTLLDFVKKPHHEADKGGPGSGGKKNGRDGKSLYLNVPIGTVVYKNGVPLYDLVNEGDQIKVAEGGRGGRGNLHFKSSVRQAPRIAELGEPSAEIQYELHLKLIADVGLVGFPNAGKSTLLSRLTRANPKIASYPFTTLHPNLGVSNYHDREFVFADIPGLIEGAHMGKGLGHQFLRHIERTKMIVHVVDPMGFDKNSPKEAIKIINNELKNYSKVLSQKPQIIVVNKSDLTGAEKVYKELKRAFRAKKVIHVSGVSGEGIKQLTDEVAKMLEKIVPEKEILVQAPTHVKLEPEFWVEKENELYIVKGKKVEALVAMTKFDLSEAVERTQHILKKMGVERELFIHGARHGDPVKIGKVQFDFEPQTDIEDPQAIRRRKELINPL